MFQTWLARLGVSNLVFQTWLFRPDMQKDRCKAARAFAGKTHMGVRGFNIEPFRNVRSRSDPLGIGRSRPKLFGSGPSHSEPFRTLRSCSETFGTVRNRLEHFKTIQKARLSSAHPVNHRLVEHSAYVSKEFTLGSEEFTLGSDGGTDYGRLHGREGRERMFRFGERIMWCVPKKM